MALLDANLLAQLKEVFKRLENKVNIVNFTDENNEKANELEGFLNEFSTVSDKIVIENVSQDDSRFEEFGIERLPALAFVDAEGNFTGGKFYGIPGGHEINSFVITLLNLDGKGKGFDQEVLDRISRVEGDVDLKVFVTLACHHCPDVVANTQHLAIKNKNIKAEMVDISLFPEVAQAHGVKSVPTVVYNGGKALTIGAKNINEILDKIEEVL